MNKEKLNDYHVTGSIHTLSVKSPGQVEIDPDVARCIDAAYSRNKDRTTSIINPNKLMGDLFKYSEFETAFESILAASGINDYNIVRADMRFDSYDPDHYRRYAKLNRYLISLLAVQYKVENCYRTENLFSQRQLSVAIKNKYFEIENYDKAAESQGKDPAKSRLEERSKAWKDKDLQHEFTGAWFDRWDKALTDQNIEMVQKTYNDYRNLVLLPTNLHQIMNRVKRMVLLQNGQIIPVTPYEASEATGLTIDEIILGTKQKPLKSPNKYSVYQIGNHLIGVQWLPKKSKKKK